MLEEIKQKMPTVALDTTSKKVAATAAVGLLVTAVAVTNKIVGTKILDKIWEETEA